MVTRAARPGRRVTQVGGPARAEQQSKLEQKVEQTRAVLATVRASGEAAGDAEHGKLLHAVKELASSRPTACKPIS